MTCPKCHTEHDPARCQGHVIKDPVTREPIDPRQCEKTPVKGASVCRSHGAAQGTPARAAAEERLKEAAAEQQLAQLVWRQDAPPVESAVLELQLLAGQLRQSVNTLGTRLNQSVVCPTCHRGPEPIDGPTGRAWLTAVREQRQLLATMESLGLAGRQVTLEENRAALVTAAFRGALAVAEQVLPVAVRDLMAREFLTLLGRPPVELEAGEQA